MGGCFRNLIFIHVSHLSFHLKAWKAVKPFYDLVQGWLALLYRFHFTLFPFVCTAKFSSLRLSAKMSAIQIIEWCGCAERLYSPLCVSLFGAKWKQQTSRFRIVAWFRLEQIYVHKILADSTRSWRMEKWFIEFNKMSIKILIFIMTTSQNDHKLSQNVCIDIIK